MNNEKQVVAVNLAERLKEAGYPQEGLWWWVEWASGKTLLYSQDEIESCRNNVVICKDFVAPTVAELGERLPDYYLTYRGRKSAEDKKWWYISTKDDKRFNLEPQLTEANARAKIWLYLKENNLLTSKHKE